MSFEPVSSDPQQQPEQPKDHSPDQGEVFSFDQPERSAQMEEPMPQQQLPYQGKGFWDMWQESKWLRKLSGNTSIAFMMIFLALLAAGSYASVVEFRRLHADDFAALADSMATSQEDGSTMDSTQRELIKQFAEAAHNTQEPGMLERIGLRALAALGFVGFFVFCNAAVSEISFRVYEGRPMELYEVFDTLIKSHGLRLLQLAGIFLGLFMILVVLVLALTDVESSGAGWVMLLAMFAFFYFEYRLVLSVQSLIGEELPPLQALARSWQLTKGKLLRIIWWMICFSFIFGLLTFFVYLLPLAIVSRLLAMLFGEGGEIVSMFVGIISLAIMAKHYSLIFFFQMAMYRELRLRKDGIDPAPPPQPLDPVLAPTLA